MTPRSSRGPATTSLGLVLTAAIAAGFAGPATVRSGPPAGDGTEPAAVDVDGNVYGGVVIGDQVWLVQNLRVTRYRDGTPIPLVRDEATWCALTTGAYCPPDAGRQPPRAALGLLYNFHAVASARGLCPAGWHVPAAAEWRAAIEVLGGNDVAGGRMKETRSGSWRTPVPGTTNESGFSALPAGGRGRYGAAADGGLYATWWSSSAHDAASAWHWGLYPDSHGIRSNPGHMASGFSVRCVRDSSGPPTRGLPGGDQPRTP